MPRSSLGLTCTFSAIFLSFSAAGAVTRTPGIGDDSVRAPIQKVVSDPTIERVQRELNQAGYEAGPVDGVLGPRTRDAIRAYQRDRGLPVTGRPGQNLLDQAGGSAEETVELPPDVIDGFYITLDEVRARSDEVYDVLAGAAGDPISKDDFVATKLPEKVVPEQADRDLMQRLFGVLDMNSDGRLTRAEWNERIASDLAFADQNEDGRITLKELSNARENIGIGDALSMIF